VLRPWRTTGFVLALALAVGVGCTSSSSPAPASGRLPLRTLRNVRLPGRTTRFDYQSIDPAQRRLYVAHLGDSAVVVVDLDRLRPIATIDNIADVHGVLAVPELNRVFATATGSNELVAIDATTNRVIGRVATGNFPDGLAYDPVDNAVLVSNKNAGSITIVNAYMLAKPKTLKLGHEVGNVSYDPRRRQAWAAVRTPDQLVAFSPGTRRVTRRIRLPGCDGAHGVYLAPPDRAFVACERNARLAIVNRAGGRVIGLARVGADPDVLAVDRTDGRLYVAAESGVVTVLATRSTVRLLARAHLAGTAHSVAVDPRTRRVLFPLEDSVGHAVLRIMERQEPESPDDRGGRRQPSAMSSPDTGRPS
jgi:YVTN family beta-propeller protein